MTEVSGLSSPAGRPAASNPPLTFTFEGRTIQARPGQSIAAALYAAGVRTFTRSFKYHRPRGLLCVSGDCPNCLMHVDGRPNVRTCVEPARQGQIVTHQNAWPGLGFDALRIFDHLDWFLPVGFYYRRFHKPRWLWPFFEHIIRRIAGLGRIDVNMVPDTHAEVEHWHAEVCVVGGGPTGLAAALDAVQTGSRVLLLERQPRLGGHLLFDDWGEEKRLDELLAGVAAQKRIQVRTDAAAFGLYAGNLLGAVQSDRLLRIRAGTISVCTGGRQRPFLFHNNDLPGIFLSDGVLRLGRLHGVKAGNRAVVVMDHNGGVSRVPEQLRQLGIEVAAVVDLREQVIVQADGYSHLKSVRVARIGSGGKIAPDSEKTIACDLLCMASERVPANELTLQAGAREPLQSRARQEAVPDEVPKRKRFVCLCEDVTEKDLARAVDEGFDNIETLKRYSTVNMGPCQGKMCGLNAAEVCARLTHKDMNTVGLTTSRPPLVPVEMCVLAADRHHHPVRRTPLHHWHQAAGATWLDAGLWKRPESYGDTPAEVRAVRTSAGLIDVGTLGKIEVIGPDAAQLLERIYLNKWADLKVGRIRYGAMCTEEGILFDDGVGARRGPERFYLTATTGNTDAVLQWLEMWRTIWGLDATLVNQTSALGAMNLAGPGAREILGRLTSLNLGAGDFPYMSFQEGEVAGVPCLLLRIGFVGELGYEIHCPAALAGHLWNALCDAGKDCGMRPFGVEAQRVLRLEKGHLLFGVDTDALSNPLEAGLEWLVRFDKPAFHGREPLLRLKARGPRSSLVGFFLEGQHPPQTDWRTLEGCQVIDAGRPVGRVTSMRHSPTFDRPLGLAWVPVAKAQPGQRFTILWDGADVIALVAKLPFYDPEMKRLKG